MNQAEQIKKIFEDCVAGNTLHLGRLLTLVENENIETRPYLKKSLESLCAPIIAITGAPGAGKSTITGMLIRKLREKNLSVALVAIDPSNPIHGGAVLGDRIRWADHYNDSGVFIRSLGSRGKLGGTSNATIHMCNLLSALKFDVVLLETVGIGQNEIDASQFADKTVLVLVPESGDSIQTLKSGAMEFADLFVVNKCDRPESENLINEIKNTLDLQEKSLAVYGTTSVDPASYDAFINALFVDISIKKKPTQKRIQYTLKCLIESAIQKSFSSLTQPKAMHLQNPYTFIDSIDAWVNSFNDGKQNQ